MGKEGHLPCATSPFCTMVTEAEDQWERAPVTPGKQKGLTFPTHSKGSCNTALERFSCVQNASCDPASTWCLPSPKGGILVREFLQLWACHRSHREKLWLNWRQAWRKGEPDLSLQEAEAWELTGQEGHVPKVTAQRHMQEAPTRAAAARPQVTQLGCSKLGRSLAPVLPKTWRNMGTALKKKHGTSGALFLFPIILLPYQNEEWLQKPTVFLKIKKYQ